MKKSVLLFVLLLASVGMWAQKKIMVYVEDGNEPAQYQLMDWTEADQYPFGYSDEEGMKITVGEEGLEYFVPKSMDYMTPEAPILEGATLLKDRDYKVVITAKIPSDGSIEVHLGSDIRWVSNSYVAASDNFQEISFLYEYYELLCEGNGKVIIRTDGLIGTTVISKVEIYDVTGDRPVEDPYPTNWVNIINNSDMEGDDVSCFYTDREYCSTIVEGTGYDGTRGVVVTSTNEPENAYDSQFHLRLPQALPAGSYYRISFDYMANNYVYVPTEAHAEPGEYIDWGFFDDIYFTPYWQHFETEGIVNKNQSLEDKMLHSIAFDLANIEEPTTYYFDNIVFEIDESKVVDPDYPEVQPGPKPEEKPAEPIAYQLMDWTEAEEYPFDPGYEDFTTSIGEEGLELAWPYVNSWSPSVNIFDKATLIAGHDYKVVITAKVPSDANIEIGMGKSNNMWWNGISVTGSEDFQEISYRFDDYGQTTKKAKIYMDYYRMKETFVIQKVEIFDTTTDPVPYQSKDWTNCTEDDLYWSEFTEGSDESVKATADGIEIDNPEYSQEYWLPQTKVMDGIVLKRDHQYIIRVTAKVPHGDLYLRVGDEDPNSNTNTYHKYIDYASNDFRDFDFEFSWENYSCNGDGVVLFQNGWTVGTCVVKKVEIFDMTMLTPYDVMAMTGKITVRGYQELDFPKDTDPDFKPSIELSYDNNNWNLGRLTLNGNLSVISDLSMSYDFARASDYNRWYEDLMSWDNDRQYFTSFINNAATSIDAATVTIRLMPYRWEFIALPFDVRVKDIKGSNNVPFVIRKYDGQKRAEGLLDETWVDMTEDDILQAGVGYIWQTAYNYDGDYYNTFVLKAAQNANLNKVLTSDDVEMPLDVHKGDLSWNLGWNLIGNPYPSYFDSRAMSFTAPFTVWSNYYGTYEAFSPIDDAYILNPGQAFFVQSTEDQSSIIFRSEGRQSDLEVNYDAVYGNRARQVTPSAERKVVNLIVSNGEFGDRTRIVINPEASLSYEADKDANKFMSADAKAIQLYSIEQGVAYAINERPLSTGEVQLGINCIASGTYTLTMRTSADCTVVLIDRLTGEEVILDDTEGYTFQSETGTFDNRFVVRFSVGDNATGIQTVTDAQPTDNIYYDMQGRRISRPEKGIYIQNGKKVMVK